MSNDRFRIPQDPNYFEAIGLAAIAFARLEWNAVWCCQTLENNYISTIESRTKTAEIIAKDLERLFSRVTDTELRSKIAPFAVEFSAIVKERNGLLHGKPGTTANGNQRLFRNGVEWTIDRINEFSDRCVKAELPLNTLLYNEFKEPCSITLHPI